MSMKGRVVALTGFLTILYLSVLLAAAKRAQVQACGAATQDSERTHAASSSKGEAAKAGPKTPGELLTRNKKLSDKLSALLGQQNAPATDLQVASQGFKILVVFVATVHISDNLGIPFDQLKNQVQIDQLTNHDPTSGSLSKAIHVLRPDADAKAEVKKAAQQAVDDLEESYWVVARSFSPSIWDV
jgi:hypothetical protein